MTIVDEKLLASIRLQPCAWCGKAGPSDPAHIFCRGMGGGSRLDTAWAVAPLCRACHDDQHAGRRPVVADLLAIAAARCGVLQRDIEAAVYWCRRVPNGATETRVREELKSLKPAARKLVIQALKSKAA